MNPNDAESFRTFSLFHLCLILMIQSAGAELKLISSHQPIVALAGDDVILPCCLRPPISASSETVVWTRPDLVPKYIHVHQDGQPEYHIQNPSYRQRTALFVDELTNGNVSLKIFRVNISDSGRYFCIIESVQTAASIQLTVGVASTPVTSFTSNNNRGVVLQCESKGWYPEPEVFWLDGEGNLLPAGPPETVRGPDELYTVSSRVTVEKRHSNNFTCRVQQSNIKQTRETHIHVPDDFFIIPSSEWYWVITIVSAAVVLVILVRLLLRMRAVWTRRNQKCEREERDAEHNTKETLLHFQRSPRTVRTATKNHNANVNAEKNEPENRRMQPKNQRKKTKNQREQPEKQRMQPRNEREQPEDQQMQPEDQQEQPEDQQMQPEDQQEQPEDQQEQPEDQQEQPEDQQMQPEDQQEQPEDQQMQLEVQMQPEDQQEQPEDQQMQLEDQQEQPEDQQEQPEDQQEQPEDQQMQLEVQMQLEDQQEQPEDQQMQPEDQQEQPEDQQEQP